MSAEFIKGGCTRCGGHIEFPANLAGSEVKCPHCAQSTQLLDNLAPAPTAAPSPAPESKPSAQRSAPAAREPRAASSKAAPAQPKVSQECPGCGLEVSIVAEECPGCGAKLKKKALPWIPVAAAAAVVLLIGGGIAFFMMKKGTPSAAEAVAGSEPVEAAPDNRFSMSEERKVTLSGKFELLSYEVEKIEGRSLIYVIGTVTNGTPQQAFGVKVTFDLKDAAGGDAGTATDYLSALPSGDAWEFRALVLDTNAAKATLSALEKEME